VTDAGRPNRAIRACRAAGLPVVDEQGCTCLLSGKMVVLAGSNRLRVSWPYAGCPLIHDVQGRADDQNAGLAAALHVRPSVSAPCDDRTYTAHSEEWKAMTDTGDKQITLTMKGTPAERGVSLSDFESFIGNFLTALRDYDRAGRGQETKKSGHPDRRAEAVTAFRLVGFRTGSGIATLEPELVSADEDEDALFDEEPISLTNLKALTADLASERAVPQVVIESLEKACRAAGSDGSLSIGLPGSALEPLVVDAELLDRIANASTSSEPSEVTTVSGRLHLLDLEPDRLGIRTTGGVEWLCKYPESLEDRVKAMLDRIVWVKGSGTLTSHLRGTMAINRIESVDLEQSPLFTIEQIDERVLASRQGISAPQGLSSLAVIDWDDASDDLYLAALLEK
jgi:hypothetical protein